jgi:hypothetical protein
MPTKNAKLSAAKAAKNDEFYTQANDIRAELEHGDAYRNYLKGKTVLCNCDDPFESNFVKYFLGMFGDLGLKKFISTSYSDSKIQGTQLRLFDDNGNPDVGWNDENSQSNPPRRAYALEIDHPLCFQNGKSDDDNIIDLVKNINPPIELNGDGSYDSPECLKYLQECDVVVTNPPFSKFRSFISTVLKYNKKFIVIGNQNALTYKEIFPLIKDGKMWLGYNSNKVMNFSVPDNYTGTVDSETGKKMAKVPAISWFTNIDIPKRHEIMEFSKVYLGHENEYPKYDSYDAINVNKTEDIPGDYTGYMGVPITFLDKYNPDQFDIIDCNNIRINDQKIKNTQLVKDKDSSINGKPTYARVLIQRKQSDIDRVKKQKEEQEKEDEEIRKRLGI